MPQPKTARCTGVLHLHGRLADLPELEISSETDLVLTSAEFGAAYLRSGWASRYVYDLARAYTVVLVGYQADDPPMRYLLEALEADRERFADLRKVYAFGPCKRGDAELERALWQAKAVEPILYTANNEDHSSLYESLREWRHYQDDPTAWRREQLRTILSKSPDSLPEAKIGECAALLSHGDASRVLGELSPNAEWLPFLVKTRVFDRDGARPGNWISTRLNDPDMIRACAGLPFFDEQMQWDIDRAVMRDRSKLTPLRLKAWQLMLSAKRARSPNHVGRWYLVTPQIKAGHAGFEARRLATEMLCPRLKVEKAFLWREELPAPGEPEALHQLLHLDFQPAEHPPLEEILRAWPETIDDEAALFRSLDRALMDSLEEALDAKFISNFDRASWNVPSVAPHSQNANRSGFYPIIRALADLWQRIADHDRDLARTLALRWTDSHFLLVKRLWLFALAHQVFMPSEAAESVQKLDDQTFWDSGARVEIMRLLTTWWSEFDPADRSSIEARVRQGIARDLVPSVAIEDEVKWVSIRDSSIFRRLKRIEAAGGVLAIDSQNLLKEISARHPQWKASAGDRDDFSSWIEGGWGPMGHPELLEKIADESLVNEAVRLQSERPFEEGDVWRKFCSADPYRALQGLGLEASHGRWEAGAWRDLLWAAFDNGEQELQFQLADLLLQMPDGPLQKLLRPAAMWLQKRREVLSAADCPDGLRFFALWDRLAVLTYREQEPEVADTFGDDPLEQSLNSPGAILAWSLFDALIATNPAAAVGLGPKFERRFDKILVADGRPGIHGRVYLIRYLPNLEWVDPAWTEVKLTPLLYWDQPEALAMWRSYSQAPQIGSPRLFNALKPAMLNAFERSDLSDREFDGLISKMLAVGLWRRRGHALDYDLANREIKRALAAGPPTVRKNASWNFWRTMGDEKGEPADKATRWRQIIGPFFRDIWPLDASLRNEEATRNLVMMALECEAAFPEAVIAILDLVVPYQLYQISHSLRLEPRHDQLVPQHPLAFVRLANALIDPAAYPVPNDLATLLQDCLSADPAVANAPAYIRLYGLRRQRGA